MSEPFKVLLIAPCFRSSEVATSMKEVHLAMECKPPLGILSIATYLRQTGGFDVQLIDNQLEGYSDDELARRAAQFDPDVVGVSVGSFKLYEALTHTRAIKRACPRAHVCWGGPHLSIYPGESLALPGVDSIVCGDGEVPFKRLCDGLRSGAGVEGIPGVYTRQKRPPDGEFVEHYEKDLDQFPMPDLRLLPYRRYRAFLTGAQMATVVTARGCPFHCIFCKLDRGKLRFFSLEKIIGAIESYLALGVKEIEFYDETFNFTVERTKAFARAVLERGLKFEWSFRGRIDQVDEEMLELIKAAGCRRIQYGVEAGTDRVLKVLRKGTTVDQIRRCFELTSRAGIDTVAYLILGSPSETVEEMEQTIRLMKQIRPTYIEYTVFYMAPGTSSYDMAMEQGVIERDWWRLYAADPGPRKPLLTWTKECSYQQLDALRKKAVREFYLCPSYIVNRLCHLRLSEVRRTLATGLGMLMSGRR